jgi:hypothetical protein
MQCLNCIDATTVAFFDSPRGVVFETSITLHLRYAGADDLILDSQPASGVSACSKS